MQLWIYRVKKLTRDEKRCILSIHEKRYVQGKPCMYTIAVTLAVRSHLFSYRTQKLSSLAPKILDWRRSGKIGCCCIQTKKEPLVWVVLFYFIALCNNHFPAGRCRKLQTRSLINNTLNAYSILEKQITDVAYRLNACCCIQKESIHQKMGAFLFQQQPYPVPPTATLLGENVAVYNRYFLLINTFQTFAFTE